MATGNSTVGVQERRAQLLELIRTHRFATLDELAKALSVSESTIRRDLDYLEEQGDARRIHGGVLYTGSSPKLPDFDVRQPIRWIQKKAIAKKTVELIEPSDAILLDGGSTTYEVARLLVGKPLHVVTNSLPVANLFSSDAVSDLVLIGGNICPRSGVARGPYADKMIASLRVRKTILSVAAINEQGFFNNNLLVVETERAMMRAADEVIVVADSSKFGHQSLAHLCRLGEVKYLISDDGLSDRWCRLIEQTGTKVILAPVPHEDGEQGKKSLPAKPERNVSSQVRIAQPTKTDVE